MAVAATEKKEPYNLDLKFERMVVAMACAKPRFYTRIAEDLDGDCLRMPSAKLALRAAKAIARESGHGPSSSIMVIQRLRRWMSEGQVAEEDIEEVGDLLDLAEDAGFSSEDDVVAELVPILKRRLERKGINEALTDFAKKGDMSKGLALLARAQRLGLSTGGGSMRIGAQSFDEIQRLRSVEKLSTGILELDDVLLGGAGRGTASIWIGSSGGGKSMGLVQVACAGALSGFVAAYATLELNTAHIASRVKANLTGVIIDDIMGEPDTAEYARAKSELAKLQSSGSFGDIYVKKFTPKVTTILDLKAWVKEIEEETGRPVDVVVVDYLDKVGDLPKNERKNDNSYTTALNVFEDFRVWMEEEMKWGWSASQSKRGEGSKEKGTKLLDIDDVADSLHKVRVADLVITLNPRDEYTQMMFFVAKNRLGKARQKVGPLPCEFECARIAPILLPYTGPTAPRAKTNIATQAKAP